MVQQTFKEYISNGLQFYFKPHQDSSGKLFYTIDGYQNKIKSFKIVQKEADEKGNKWQIAHDAIVPLEIKNLEQDFINAITSDREVK